MKNNLQYRYIARIILEAQTPLFVGSGDSSLLKDALVQKDAFGLPLIPGTSLAGVLRHTLSLQNNDPLWNDIFGYQDSKTGVGSRCIISSAYFLLGNEKVAETVNQPIDTLLLQKLDNLPSRQHVRINDKGAAQRNGLFDNEVVYKGARFIFEIELKGTETDGKAWDDILSVLTNPLFRIGQGTRKGYGKLGVHKLYTKTFDLTKPDDFQSYLDYNPSFNCNPGLSEYSFSSHALTGHYRLELKPDDFFIFSKGSGDEEADNKPVTEEIIIYKNEQIVFEEQAFIPATSIKGAIAHRVAYYYNKIQNKYADHYAGEIGINNAAVRNFFGNHEGAQSKRGDVIIDDLYFSLDDVANTKIFNHVAIDRFTGGAMSGALFSEKVSRLNFSTLTLHVYLTQSKTASASQELDALESALTDICKGLLPLGGMTTKGHGMFTGALYKNDVLIFNYDETELI